jgi:DNA-binding NtrC family response regulator
MPALRERIEDIPFILDSFKLKTRAGLNIEFSPEALRVLKSYYWPGNIRQLQQIAERVAMIAESNVVRPADIYKASPEFVVAGRVLQIGSKSEGLKPAESERMRFLIALDQAGGRREDAAKILGLSRATFFRKLKELGMVKSY